MSRISKVTLREGFCAQLLSIYPASIVTHGQALNITCQSYNGQMNFGFTGCHSSLPSMQRLAVYASDALEELEAAILPRPARSRAPRKAVTAGTVPPRPLARRAKGAKTP